MALSAFAASIRASMRESRAAFHSTFALTRLSLSVSPALKSAFRGVLLLFLAGEQLIRRLKFRPARRDSRERALKFAERLRWSALKFAADSRRLARPRRSSSIFDRRWEASR